MISNKLLEVYKRINPALKKIYVVPLINYHIKNSDYLYLLYKPIIENNFLKIVNLSAARHYKLLGRGIRESILHYHWFEITDIKSLLGIIWKTIWISLYKLFGGKIVWTIHNKFPHSGNYTALNKLFRRYFASLADKLHVHCSGAIDIMSPILNANKEKFFIVEHPNYPAELISKTDAIVKLTSIYKELKIEDSQKIFLSFGTIAKYKGLTELIAIFQNSLKKHILIIAGNVKKNNKHYYDELVRVAEGSGNIVIINKVIPDDEVSSFFNACDAAVYNYEDILTSGGVILALSYSKTVVAPSLGCIKEIKNKNLILFEKEAGSSVNLLDTLRKVAENK